jgi:CubicO group peptidase (beta-lactamase class C family)
MARLYEQGRLDLDAPIQRYVPGFPDKGFPITARHLASHRSGIRHYRDDYESLNTKPYQTAAESLEKFQDDPLLFVPDTGFAYSTYGFVLLGAAMEGASGEDFPTLMRRLVFEPLGLRHTLAEHAALPAQSPSRFYDHVTPYSTDESVVPSPALDFSAKWAGGGLLSTAEDLVRFGSAHIEPGNEGFLKSETLDLLFTPRTRHLGIFGHGLGWACAPDLHLRRRVFHFGAGSGGTAVLFVYPGQAACAAILANLGHARFPSERLAGIVNPFLSDPAKPGIAGFWACVLGAAMYWGWRRRGRNR